jgi:hypothetical protein
MDMIRLVMGCDFSQPDMNYLTPGVYILKM